MRWLASAIFSLYWATVAAAAEPNAERIAELRHLLKHDCGSCHGMTLEGGLGPALTPAALAGKPQALLQATILDGRPGTAMPPWRGILNEADSGWLAGHLLNREPRP